MMLLLVLDGTPPRSVQVCI